MKKVQRLIVLILALAMCFSLAACGSSGTQQPAQDNSQTIFCDGALQGR